MGIGGISIWQLLIILLIVVLLFGTKRLKGIGSDLGSALKGFKKAVNDDAEKDQDASVKQAEQLSADETQQPSTQAVEAEKTTEQK